MTVTKEKYKERKEKCLCTRCGEVVVTNRTLCSYHLDKANKNQKSIYNERRNKKQCTLCGIKSTNNRKICNNCLEKQVSKQRNDVWIPCKEREKKGICCQCSKPNSTKNLYCKECLINRSLYKTSKRQQRIINGLCGICGERLLAKNKKRCIICIYKHNQWYSTSVTRDKNVKKNQLLKDQIIQHYGGKCNCCHETEITFLAIDHIDGNGNIHRKKIKKSSSAAFYKWLIDQNFPNEFQILCHNCNMSKYLLGECAHKKRNK